MYKTLNQTPLHFLEQVLLINSYLRHILVYSSPLEIYLFGSASVLKMKNTSDLDFALICKNSNELKKFNKSLRKNVPNITWPVDYFFWEYNDFYSKANSSGLIHTILSKGCLIFQEGKTCHQNLTKRNFPLLMPIP